MTDRPPAGAKPPRIEAGSRVAVSWGRAPREDGSDGGFWWVTAETPLAKMGERVVTVTVSVKAADVMLDEVTTHRNEDGQKTLPGGPRGWITGVLVGYLEWSP